MFKETIDSCILSVFFFNDTATTEIYTLSLHDALPIFGPRGRQLSEQNRGKIAEAMIRGGKVGGGVPAGFTYLGQFVDHEDRKSTRLNSSHANISYAVFCLKKKKQQPSATHRSPPLSSI